MLNASTCFCVMFRDVSALCRIYMACVVQISKSNGFISFLSAGARAQVSFFLKNFDFIRTKETEMEAVYIACSGRGENSFTD